MASLVTKEAGPFSVFEKIKEFLIVGETNVFRDFLSGLYECMWCSTVWFCVLTLCLYLLEPWIVIVIAAMAIAMLAEEFVNKG